MKIIKSFLAITVLAIIAIILYLGYLGFIPFVSDIMGANKPKDLGIKYTKENFDSYVQKAQTKITLTNTGADPANSVRYSGQISLKESFSPEDISARLNYSNWKYMPVSNTQLRINSDGSMEFSANILMDRLPGFIAYAGLGKYSIDIINKGLKYVNLLKINPPLYTKFKAGVTDNNLNLNVQTIQVGRFSLPLDKLGANDVLTQSAENVFSKTTGFYAKSVNFSDGQMRFEGSVPEKMEVETN